MWVPCHVAQRHGRKKKHYALGRGLRENRPGAGPACRGMMGAGKGQGSSACEALDEHLRSTNKTMYLCNQRPTGLICELDIDDGDALPNPHHL